MRNSTQAGDFEIRKYIRELSDTKRELRLRQLEMAKLYQIIKNDENRSTHTDTTFMKLKEDANRLGARIIELDLLIYGEKESHY